MSRRIVKAKPEHAVLYQDLVVLISKHKDKCTPLELLAIAANMLGKLIAMQDQRIVTRELALRILMENIEFGNKEVIDQLIQNAKGSA